MINYRIILLSFLPLFHRYDATRKRDITPVLLSYETKFNVSNSVLIINIKINF